MAVSFSGSINISGSLATTGTIIMSGSIASASFATSAVTSSYASNATTSSFSETAVTSSYSTTSSFAASATTSQTSSYANSFTVGGTLTAQTLVVQTITSSVDFVTGSTRFGSTIGNTHVFTGSIQITSGSINNAVYSVGGNYKQWTIGDFTSGTNYNTLELKAATEPRIYFNTDSGGNAVLYNSYGNVGLSYSSGSYSNDILYYDHYYGRNLSIGAGGSTRMFISGSGNVGIGTTTPTYTLDVNAPNNVRFFGNSYTSLTIATTSGTNFSLTNRYTDNRFSIDATGYGEVMNFMSDGKVGIGTSLPNSFVEIVKSSNAGSGASFPRLAVANSLATQGNGTSTYNFADLRLAAGNAAVEVYLTATYAAGTWEPQGILNVGTNHPLSFKTNNTERMRILAGGNVGIGTTSPQGILEAVGVSYFTRSGASLLLNPNYGGANTHAQIQVVANMALAFATNFDNERMRITSAGKIGIGTTSPYGTFEIAASSQTYAGSPSITFTDTTGDAASNRWIVGNIATTYGTFNIASATTPSGTSWTPRLTILSNGNVGIGTSSPTAALTVYGNGVGSAIDWTNTTSSTGRSYRWVSLNQGGFAIEDLTASGTKRLTILSDGQTLINSSTDTTSGGFTSATVGIKQLADGSSGGGLHIEQASNTNVAFFGFTGNAFRIGTSYRSSGAYTPIEFNTNGQTRLQITTGGTVQPGANGTQDLGTSSLRWSTVYTSDLSLSNGIGDYTIVEGENDLFLYNNKQNKVYKFVLAEVDPADATPKKS